MHYELATHYAGQSLIDGFSFFTGEDPSGGFVNYQSKADALTSGLASINGTTNQVRLGVDSTNSYATNGTGRPSVRLTSDQKFNHGLFIADFAHMPSSACGVWPTFWAFNSQNANGSLAGGEVNIIEGANTAQRNMMSAHTEAGCSLPSDGFTGVVQNNDCGPRPDKTGCNFAAPATDTMSYGDAFNAGGGGVYAMEWDEEALRIWHFPRSTIPIDITLAGAVPGSSTMSPGPDPESWGPPQAVFGGAGCNPDTYFYDLSLVLNINFCGEYAGRLWGEADQCSERAPTCEDWVAGNPSAFAEASWDVNYIDVYNMRPVIDPGMGNGTFPNTTMTGVPSQTRTATLAPASTLPTGPAPSGAEGGQNPGTVDGYTYLGCFGSQGGFQPWTLLATFPDMDIEACVASCADHKYAGVFDESCYCADSLGDASAVDTDECDFVCPGNDLEFCGGLVDDDTLPTPGGNGTSMVMPTASGSSMVMPTASGSSMVMSTASDISLTTLTPSISGTPFAPSPSSSIEPIIISVSGSKARSLNRRDAPTNLLLTVYGDLSGDDLPPPAPGTGGEVDGDDDDDDDSNNGDGSDTTTTRTITTALTVTYLDVCPTNPAELIKVEYCTTTTYTVEECGCTADAHPSHNTAAPPPPPGAGMPMPTGGEAGANPNPNGNASASAAVGPPAPTVPMATVTETCDACGPSGESTVTLTIPVAVVTEVTITALSLQTPAPGANGTLPSNGTMPVTAGAAAGHVLGWSAAAVLGLLGSALLVL